MESELKTKLCRSIWITRKCRINASERLLRTAKFVELINVYYSIVIITLSLFSLWLRDSWLSVASLMGSIMLTISIVYANATGLRERSMALKQNYISLQILLDKLALLAHDDEEALLKIDAEYAELLKTSENHLTIDMYQLNFNAKDPDPKLKWNERLSWIFHCMWSFIRKLILLAFPVVSVIGLWLWERCT